MNDRLKLRNALVSLIRGIAPDEVTVIPVMKLSEGDNMKESRAILIERTAIDAEPFEQANPPVGCVQRERYRWALRFIGGGGGRTPRERLDALDKLLDDVQSGLEAQRLTGSFSVGPFEFVSEEEDGEHTSGVSVVQRWTHEKNGAIDP
jgi:hypothetical protein